MDILYREMEEYACEHSVPVIGCDGARLLKAAVEEKKPSRILEIGTAIGYSALMMAEHSPDAEIVTIEIDSARADIAREFFIRSGIADRIDVLVGDAAKIIPEIPGKFDFVFIDAAKGQYLEYLRGLLDKLAEGAVIVADNVLFRGWVLDGQEPPRRFRTIVRRLREYINFVSCDPRFISVIHQSGDGVAISVYQGENKA